MSEIYSETMGFAILVQDVTEIPAPCKFIAAFNGYRFYRADVGMYAVEE